VIFNAPTIIYIGLSIFKLLLNYTHVIKQCQSVTIRRKCNRNKLRVTG
jgi:hypothetical protein